jgi:hypothetical protein
MSNCTKDPIKAKITIKPLGLVLADAAQYPQCRQPSRTCMSNCTKDPRKTKITIKPLGLVLTDAARYPQRRQPLRTMNTQPRSREAPSPTAIRSADHAGSLEAQASSSPLTQPCRSIARVACTVGIEAKRNRYC